MARNIFTFCFFLSGVAGLVYQIIWVRMFSLSFGNTVYAVSLVVAAFLAGLALGSHVLGKVADRLKDPKNSYVLLEVLIAVSAVVVSAAIGWIDDIMASLMTVEEITSFKWQAARFISAFIALLIPTFLMGGTLPVMSKFYITSMDRLGKGVGVLYAANTYGAMVGAFLSGFVMIKYLGVWNTLFAAFLANFLVAGLVWLVPAAQQEKAGEAPKPGAPAEEGKKKRKKGKKEARMERAAYAREEANVEDEDESGFEPLIAPAMAMALMAAAGFSSIALEILWTRGFVVSFKSTVYLFSGLLSIYLLGMALGSHVFSRVLDKVEDPLRLLGLAQLGVGIWAFVSVPIFMKVPGMAETLAGMFSHMTLSRDMLVMLALMGITILPPAFLMGISFPLLTKVITESLGSLGRRSGMAYATGTLGGIGGSLLAGFVMLPMMGLQISIFLVGAVALLTGYTAITLSRRRPMLAWALPTTLATAIFIVSVVYIAGVDVGLGRVVKEKVALAMEGATGSVRVIEDRKGGPLTLMVNDYQLATSGDVAVRFGHLPMILHPDAKSALVISLGSGITTGAVGGHPVERIDCVELVPELMDVQRLFEKDNHKIAKDERLHVTFWDGRNYARVSKRKYDVVISDLFQPDSAGVGALYSLEHYQNVKARLAEGGIMAQWLPLYQLSAHDLKVIMRTFAYAFENVTVWSGDTNSQLSTLLLVGSAGKMEMNLDKISKALGRERVQMDMIEHNDLFSFLSFYVMDRAEALEFTKGHPINTDARPVIEYSAPYGIWDRASFAVENFTTVAMARKRLSLASGDPEKTGALNEAMGDYFKARTYLLQGRVNHARQDYPAELENYKEAYKLAPMDPFLGLAVFDLGYLYYSRGDFRTASQMLDWARRINAQLLEAYFYLMKSYHLLGEKDKAEMTFQELAKISPELARSLMKQ
ncbi:MAG: fused MFS/spermidine synthase [Nitrospinota bacterium]|nr:fused MFS/spermidine synthase [Nitrospinota bacterium]